MAWGKEWAVPSHNTSPIVNVSIAIAEINKLKTQGSNLVDDQAYLYFQCQDCLDIFDPNTKSFATLNQKRHEAGWKVCWNMDGMGYKVYCVKCGEDG